MTMMAGKKALIELLRNEGVKYVFGIPGATEIQFMDAMEKAPDIQYILDLHEVAQFAELIGSCVYASWMSDVNFPVTHPQYLGDLDPTSPQAKDILKDKDLLIGIGCSLFGQGFFNSESTLSPNMRIIQIDENPWEIGKNFHSGEPRLVEVFVEERPRRC